MVQESDVSWEKAIVEPGGLRLLYRLSKCRCKMRAAVFVDFQLLSHDLLVMFTARFQRTIIHGEGVNGEADGCSSCAKIRDAMLNEFQAPLSFSLFIQT